MSLGGFGMGLVSASAGPVSNRVVLNNDLVKSYKMAQVFKGSEDACITSVDFHKLGEFCVAASSEGSISLYNSLQGRCVKTVLSKTYGCEIIKYTHHADSIIYSSNNEAKDHRIRYHSLYDNVYLRHFEGHTDRVVSMVMSPTEDLFLSASLDKSVRFWDVRTPTSVAIVRTPGRPCVGYDPSGLAFAAATGDNVIRLYDARQYQAGPFVTFNLEPKAISATLQQRKPDAVKVATDWLTLSITFSADGAHMIVGTDRGLALQLDSFNGNLVSAYVGHQNASGMDLPFSYSPDAKYVVAGSTDNKIYAWSAVKGELLGTWEGHVSPVRALQWNPMYNVVASGANTFAFWQPDQRPRDNKAVSIK